MTSTIVEPLLHAEHLTKSYGARPVLKDASLSIARGEIHALLGENGSGKSTLIKLLAGQIAPDGGYAPSRPPRVVVSGRSENLPIDPKTAQSLKLGFVHQDLGLVLSSTVTETLGLGRFRTHWGMINWRAQRSYTTEILQRYGLNLSPEAIVGSLSAVERAMLSIIRGIESISGDERGVLILDEPTAYLPADAVHQVFGVLRRIRATGSSVLIVTHRLDEVKEICDRATILRSGEVVATMDIASVTTDDLVTAILGTELTNLYPQEHTTVAEPVLRVTNLGGTETRGVSLVASRGEILGLTGLVGDGFEEIISLCFGATRGTGQSRDQGRDGGTRLASTPAGNGHGHGLHPGGPDDFQWAHGSVGHREPHDGHHGTLLAIGTHGLRGRAQRGNGNVEPCWTAAARSRPAPGIVQRR